MLEKLQPMPIEIDMARWIHVSLTKSTNMVVSEVQLIGLPS